MILNTSPSMFINPSHVICATSKEIIGGLCRVAIRFNDQTTLEAIYESVELAKDDINLINDGCAS